MKTKIIFSDLDGTLLKDDKTISKENREAIRELLQQGHYFVIVTGRPVATGRIVAKDLGLTMPGCYMVAFNGAVLYDCAADRILKDRTVPMDVVHDIFEKAGEAGIYAQTYQQNHILTTKHSRELDFYIRKAKMDYKLTDDLFGQMKEEPNKVILIDIDQTGRLEEFKKAHPELEERCSSFFSCNEYLEYCPQDTNKGTGVKDIVEFLNVALEDTIAIGDERNDIPMLKAAGIGAAVAGSRAEVLAAADYITENDHNHNAVAEVIRKFVLQ